MSRATGIVEDGKITLPPEVRLPEGAEVLIEWNEESLDWGPPLEREPWTEEEMRKEIERARSEKWKL
jgi:hypothetical protein